MTILASIVLATTLTIGGPAPEVKSENDGLPAWLAGSWMLEDGSAWGDEVWMAPRGGVMIGMARTGFGPKLENWEVTRIQRKADGRITFFAQPYGRTASEFPVAVQSEESIEFANPLHDYPQRIRYWRQGQLLMAEISRIDGSRAVRFNYRPVAAPVLETPPPEAAKTP